ncbi:MAG: hypothetical protein ACE15F_24610 [bacterium]
MVLNRRTLLRNSAALGAGLWLTPAWSMSHSSNRRRFHVCLNVDVLERDPDLLSIVRNAGVDTVWLAGFFYGHWPYSVERLQAAREKIEAAGMDAHIVNVPLGHPGDSLDAKDGNFPLTPPRSWKLACRPDGSTYAGTSLHAPATAENISALKTLREAGFSQFFLDDDFRLAPAPGQIGGCFCPEHRDEFLRLGGYAEAKWNELLGDAQERRLTPLLRNWIEFQCDALTQSFREQQQAVGGGRLGIMVMYLGAEKAGIRLSDYRDVPFRVGELMFDDASFGRVKGKTDELFSALMHRRFARPELAFSESTAFPADRLSARNLAAKLAVSTLSDVRNTMFMSGITPFPRTHWETLGPAMKRQAEHHARLMGHTPHGPFKLYWGEAGRWVGDDQPFSLFLAAGVPFEVTDQPAKEGWTFLSDFDARALGNGTDTRAGTTFLHRPSARVNRPGNEPLEESLKALFAFKQRIAPRLEQVPYVEENVPVVCAWYPSARSVLLWNLTEESQVLTLKFGESRRMVKINALETAWVGEVG